MEVAFRFVALSLKIPALGMASRKVSTAPKIYNAPATAIYETIDAIFNDRKRLLPSIAYLEGEYGCSDICFGVPTIIGYQGIEKIIEVDMNNDEYQQLQHSAQAVSEVKNSLKFK